jgi:hypothetical protein
MERKRTNADQIAPPFLPNISFEVGAPRLDIGVADITSNPIPPTA